MNTIQVNAYNNNFTNKALETKDSSKSALDSMDFLKLLAAQMSNQDVMNPAEDTQFISQMAQFTSLKTSKDLYNNSNKQLDAIKSLSQICYLQYGATLAGKSVHGAYMDSDGKYKEYQGMVNSVNFANDDFTVSVDGKEYALSSVMEVLSQTQETASNT